MKKIFFICLVIILVNVIQFSIFAKNKFDVEQAILNGQHKELSEYYHKQAEEQKSLAEMHIRMGRNYTGSVGNRDTSLMKKHCQALKEGYLKSAEEYESLSKKEMELSNQ